MPSLSPLSSLVESLFARVLKKFWQSSPMPPFVPNTSGVKVPISKSITPWMYFLFFSFSCSLKIVVVYLPWLDRELTCVTPLLGCSVLYETVVHVVNLNGYVELKISMISLLFILFYLLLYFCLLWRENLLIFSYFAFADKNMCFDIITCNVTPMFCISIVFSFSWELKCPQEKLKTMLMQNIGVTNKEYHGMLWYFL